MGYTIDQDNLVGDGNSYDLKVVRTKIECADFDIDKISKRKAVVEDIISRAQALGFKVQEELELIGLNEDLKRMQDIKLLNEDLWNQARDLGYKTSEEKDIEEQEILKKEKEEREKQTKTED